MIRISIKKCIGHSENIKLQMTQNYVEGGNLHEIKSHFSKLLKIIINFSDKHKIT